MRALATGSIDLVIADPPYNIAVQGAAWDTVPEYLNWSRTWLAEAARVLRPGGSLFIYGSPAKLWIARLKLIAADECGLEFKQHLSWVYKQGGDARLKGMVAYSVRMEHIEWFVKPGAAHTFNPAAAAEPYTEDERREALAKGVGRVTAESLDQGRPPRNWFDLPRENSRSKERQYGSHPSMKPLKLCERLLLVHSNPGDAVVIPFGGSGSEAVAAALASRRVVAYELDPNYYTIILRRLVGWALFPPHLAPAQPAPTAAALADAAADAADAAAAATAAAAEGGDGGDGGAAAAPAAAGGGGGLPLLRDARFSSGYLGVYRLGARWVAKVMRGGVLKSLGAFGSPREAAAAYARACSPQYGGQFDERPTAQGAMAQLGHRVDGTGPDAVAAYAALCAPTPAAAVGRPPSAAVAQPTALLPAPTAALPATAAAAPAPELAGPGIVVAPPPPPAWVWPRDGEALEVETTEGDVTAWQPAEVVAVLQDGWFQARIGHGDQAWSDWFTWQEEGTDWRRPPPKARPSRSAAPRRRPRRRRRSRGGASGSPRRRRRRRRSPTTRRRTRRRRSGGVPRRRRRCLAGAGGGGGVDVADDGARAASRLDADHVLRQVRGIQGPGRARVKTKPAAWREHERMAQADDDDEEEDGRRIGRRGRRRAGARHGGDGRAREARASPRVPGVARRRRGRARRLARGGEGAEVGRVGGDGRRLVHLGGGAALPIAQGGGEGPGARGLRRKVCGGTLVHIHSLHSCGSPSSNTLSPQQLS